MPHPNDMSKWDEIRCRRPNHTHHRRLVIVEPASPHKYRDLPQVPVGLSWGPFRMWIWDPDHHPVDGGPPCPAHDAVSETIVSHGIWEPQETILTLHSLREPSEGIVVDMGCQIGWFSLLAASCGRHVLAMDAEQENLDLLRLSARENMWGPLIQPRQVRIGPDTPSLGLGRQVRLAKLDLEGAEPDGLRILWPAIQAGLVDRLLIEVSPVFHDGYGDVVCDLIQAGYRAYMLPPKSRPPVPMGSPDTDLVPYELSGLGVRDFIDDLHQANIWFCRG